jgi:hypothetical protein
MKKRDEALSEEPKEVFPPKRTAQYLGLKSEDVLRLWRAKKEGPPFFRAGKRLVMYRKRDLDKWIEERTVLPSTNEAAAHDLPTRERPRPFKSSPRSLAIASRGVRTTHDVANLMSALMSDLIDGSVTPNVGNDSAMPSTIYYEPSHHRHPQDDTAD